MSKSLVLSLLVVLAGGAFVTAVVASRGSQASAAGPRSLTDGELPAGNIELLDVVPFALDEPSVHNWRVEKPTFDAGVLLVLHADPELVRPRQTAEAVLYVGSQTAQRYSFPETSGILVALVPAPLAADGSVALDLDSAPIWFGRRELPERVDARRIEEERTLARRAGIGPARRLDARARTLEPVRAHDLMELEATYVADLIERWSPEEADRAAGLRVR